MTAHSLFIAKNNRTLGDTVTNELREAIISGKLAPGTPLGQEKLAAEFGISRVPIREALRVLAGENLVTLESHRGATVARLSLAELDELYTIIWSVEIEAVRRAVPIMSDESIATMGAIIKKMGLARNDALGWYKLNVELHRTIMQQSGWLFAVRIVDECRRNIGRYVTDPQLFKKNVKEWTARDARLLEACQRRDVEAAVAALQVMQNQSIPAIRSYFATQVVPPADGRTA